MEVLYLEALTSSRVGMIHYSARHRNLYCTVPGYGLPSSAGIQVSHGVCWHGLALNCSVDLSWFDHIVPCGLDSKGVASLSSVLGYEG